MDGRTPSTRFGILRVNTGKSLTVAKNIIEISTLNTILPLPVRFRLELKL